MTANAPFFIPPLPTQNTGVDFLGLREVNLRLMGHLVPGLNNKTDKIRPFSVMSWAAWAFQREAAKAENIELSDVLFKRFLEKVEVLFGWGHQLNGEGTGLVGNAQVAPAHTTHEAVPLDFNAWKRGASWLDPNSYGPSLKDDNGLGFLHQRFRGVYVPTPAGTELAQALDMSLQECQGYNQLTSLTDFRATEETARTLFHGWRVSTPSDAEAVAFGRALYGGGAIGKDGTMVAARSATIAIILGTLRRCQTPLSEEALRRQLLYSPKPYDAPGLSPEPLAHAHTLWRVLQVRQAQRLAFEALFGWLEDRVVMGVQDVFGIAESLQDALRDVAWAGKDWARKRWSQIDAIANGDLLLDKGDTTEDADLLLKMAELVRAIEKDRNAIPPLACQLLIDTAYLANQLQADPVAAPMVAEGGRDRVSLKYWAGVVSANIALSPTALTTMLVENLLLSQHFAVATSRFSQGKQRLRVTIEESGLCALSPNLRETWRPRPTSDRLSALLGLLCDCGLIRVSNTEGVPHYALA